MKDGRRRGKEQWSSPGGRDTRPRVRFSTRRRLIVAFSAVLAPFVSAFAAWMNQIARH